MSETVESAKKINCFRCPNPSCGRTFAAPLKTTILKPDSNETFDACPFCLAVVTPNCIIHSGETKTDGTEEPEVYGKSPECKNYFVYLSERSSKAKIPDECMTFKSIVRCMLKTTLE